MGMTGALVDVDVDFGIGFVDALLFVSCENVGVRRIDAIRSAIARRIVE